jgi:hypothetical protein
MKRVFVWILVLPVLMWFCGLVIGANEKNARGVRVSSGGAAQEKKAEAKKETPKVNQEAEKAKEKTQPAQEKAKEKTAKAKEDSEKAKEKTEVAQEQAKEKAAKTKEETAKTAEKAAKQPEAKAKADVEKVQGKGREHAQQQTAAAGKMVREDAKHVERVARLERIKALAAAEGNTKTVERVDKLLAKENERYLRRTGKTAGQIEKSSELGEKAAKQEKAQVEDSNSKK